MVKILLQLCSHSQHSAPWTWSLLASMSINHQWWHTKDACNENWLLTIITYRWQYENGLNGIAIELKADIMHRWMFRR